MADGRHQLAGRVEVADQLQHDRVATELVGHKSAGHDQAREVGRADFGQCGVTAAGITVLAGVELATFGAGDRDRRTGLDESQPRIPKFQVLVHIINQQQEALAARGSG